MATTEQPATSESPSTHGDFGANEWLVEDMYERYLADPDSVDAAWHDFFDDYRPNVAVQARHFGRGGPTAAGQLTSSD